MPAKFPKNRASIAFEATTPAHDCHVVPGVREEPGVHAADDASADDQDSQA